MEQIPSPLKRASLFLLLFQAVFLCYQVSSLSLHSHTTTATALLLESNNSSDRLALLSFKFLLSEDPLGALNSWNDSLPLCQWPGVTCGGHRHPDRVTALHLESLDLTGPISPSLANLTFLRTIHIPGNRFQGSIPEELGRLFRLQYLNLSTNYLEGSIPTALLNCSNLRRISLRSNKLQGEIPPNFPPLTILDLSNNLFRGAIPPSLGNISSLTYLVLSNNNLTGGIPSSLGKLPFLTFFALPINNLTGDIPHSIWNLSSLAIFKVYTNHLSGTLPPELGNKLPRLQVLLLYENQFSGPIPESIANASGLELAAVNDNEFTGTIPWNLGALQNLKMLIIGNNQLEAKEVQDWRFFTGLVNSTNLQILDVRNMMLGGNLPNAIANLSTGLTWLGMMGNQISGSIPPEIANLVSLTLFDINQNLLTGRIPTTIGRLQRLEELYLSENMFSGEIPPDLGNLSQLVKLDLDGNYLSGNIPKTLGNCKNLLSLALGSNNLTGTIPVEIMSLSSLSMYLGFLNNSLTGPLPLEVGSLINLEELVISNNKLSGEIPSTLGECRVMQYLFMEGNFFQGNIPPSFSQLRGLQVLDLSHNNLSGKIPKFLEDFQCLQNLNLSFNNFEGEVPKGRVFANLSAVSVLGNNKLCGGSPGLDLPPCSILPPRNNLISSKVKEIILVVGIVVCFILLGCSLIACYSIKKLRRSSTAISMKDPHMKVSYSDLVKATDGFSTANLIGVGSFGSVYKAIMEVEKDKTVAVKVINHQQQGAFKTFMAECEALRNIRHRNLVKILTACSSVDFRGNDFKALIFEFMPNGSLEKWLHPEKHEESELRKLSLIQRLNIAIDVASALDYLHHQGEVPIVHCDLKPSDILLDDDMIAYVGDFGLARFLNKSDSKMSQISTNSSGLKGTIGYVAPEYGMANKVSTQGDVYSYGILLLEMFTGKKPTEHVFTEGLSLHKFVQLAFPGRVMDIVDAHMFLEEDGKDNNNTQCISSKRANIHECSASVLRIGLLCTQELPE